MALEFSPNERVLCYHGPLIYEAKVLKTDTWDETTTKTGVVGPHFFVHYKGWKQTWDEWVPSPRLLKFNETNIALQKSLQASAASSASAVAAVTKGKGTAGTKDPKSGVGSLAGRKEGGRGVKRGREEDDGNKRPEMKLTIPDTLKAQLVDDWEAVTKNFQLVTLPRTPTVRDLLQEFKTYASSQPPPTSFSSTTNANISFHHEKLLPTVISGLILYFDRSLGQNLLYRFERPQYADVRTRYITGQTVKIGEEKEMSEVYGAEHLLRMIVSLPAMIASSTMDLESVVILREYVHLLMTYMVKERSRIFQAQYETASSQYQNISRS